MMANSRALFVSHAAVDKAIADALVDLICLGLGVDAGEQVFCTSLEGLGVPPGRNFNEFIREQIQEPRLVILLISQNYLSSQFCLAELGASWALSHEILPILVPPVTRQDVQAVIGATQMMNLTDASDWNDACSQFARTLGTKLTMNRWERKRDDFLRNLPRLLKRQPSPRFVSLAEYQEAITKLQEANTEIGDLEAEVKRLAKLLAQVKKAKDAKTVAALEVQSMDENGQLDELVRSTKAATKDLPGSVREGLYYRFSGGVMTWPMWDDDQKQQIRAALEHRYLVEEEDHGLQVNRDDPRVKRAIRALKELQAFMECSSSAFRAAYAERHDHELVIDSRSFWQKWGLL